MITSQVCLSILLFSLCTHCSWSKGSTSNVADTKCCLFFSNLNWGSTTRPIDSSWCYSGSWTGGVGSSGRGRYLTLSNLYTLYAFCMNYVMPVLWDLFIKDTLWPANLSTVERLSTLQRWKCISTIGKSIFGALKSVLCREVVYMVSFIGVFFNRGSTVYVQSHVWYAVWWGFSLKKTWQFSITPILRL